MKPHTKVALLTALAAVTGWSQDVTVHSLTVAQMWKEDIPGFDKTTRAPLTEFLGVDATNLGSERLSLHMFGWGSFDMADPSMPDGAKRQGYLNYGYLRYRFDQANAEIKAGRFSVFQTTGIEQVDGVSARTDLRGGFSISGFVGVPVLYKTVNAVAQEDYKTQRDLIFGGRLAWRKSNVAEIGLSYLQDGTKSAKDLSTPSTTDYTRKQVGVDLLVTPTTAFDFRGRTSFDVADHHFVVGAEEPSRIAEHDYTATLRFNEQWSMTGNFAERNFFAYFAGTNLPSLFRQDEKDKFKGVGGSVIWKATSAFQLVGDYRHTNRETFGDVDKYGVQFRWANSEKTAQVGGSAHVAKASNTVVVDPTAPYRSLSYDEFRAWVMLAKGKVSGSLDGILQRYDESNPYLYGVRDVYEIVASLGYQATADLKIAGDLSFGSTPVAKSETRGLLRVEYRFGFGKKGGK